VSGNAARAGCSFSTVKKESFTLTFYRSTPTIT
jgi:hypothetical protein